ncbi:hypothetical protein [Roseibium sp.]|uniref:hypothetical protein n=1 Tax=Roseibium sp. TaxID=1936156 RepID=UPI003A96A001
MYTPIAAAAITVSMLLGSAHAGGSSIPKPGDFYMIARDSAGEFAGSHKIFHRQSSGLYKVRYCQREYWVRAHTIAWTQVEVENNRRVKVEFNFGKGWRPLCENPERQVTLADIGLTEDARMILSQSEAQVGALSRFSAISNSFQKDAPEGSYHGR